MRRSPLPTIFCNAACAPFLIATSLCVINTVVGIVVDEKNGRGVRHGQAPFQSAVEPSRGRRQLCVQWKDSLTGLEASVKREAER